MTIKNGDKVKIDYEGTLEDGTVFDSSAQHGKPLEFEIGSGQIIKGFEDAIVGMNKSQEKNITLKPEEAYGPYDKKLVKAIPRNVLPPDVEPKAGMMLGVGTPDGHQFPARITEVNTNIVTIDLNQD